tara:strand:+ start:1689 stop:1865 length:177 start_codon:yes stop_codon:yes gene_type:complete
MNHKNRETSELNCESVLMLVQMTLDAFGDIDEEAVRHRIEEQVASGRIKVIGTEVDVP